MKTNRRTLIIGAIEDAVAKFFYYDRKEDEELPRGEIEKAIECGEITIDEIVQTFEDAIRNED